MEEMKLRNAITVFKPRQRLVAMDFSYRLLPLPTQDVRWPPSGGQDIHLFSTRFRVHMSRAIIPTYYNDLLCPLLAQAVSCVCFSD